LTTRLTRIQASVRAPPVVINASAIIARESQLHRLSREALREKMNSRSGKHTPNSSWGGESGALNSALSNIGLVPLTFDSADRDAFLQTARSVEELGMLHRVNFVSCALFVFFVGSGTATPHSLLAALTRVIHCHRAFLLFRLSANHAGATMLAKKDKKAYQAKQLKGIGVEVCWLISRRNVFHLFLCGDSVCFFLFFFVFFFFNTFFVFFFNIFLFSSFSCSLMHESLRFSCFCLAIAESGPPHTDQGFKWHEVEK
jgi:hypothetical protein